MKINKNMTVEPLLKIKRQYIYSSIGDSEAVLVSERNNAGLKRLSQVLSEQTSVSSAFLNVMWLSKVCTQLCTAFLIFRSGLSDFRINCNQINRNEETLMPVERRVLPSEERASCHISGNSLEHGRPSDDGCSVITRNQQGVSHPPPPLQIRD
jgi:hypothetical protein